MPKTILIKKYENRRLYDVTNSRYVNLEEVAQFLRDGHDVRVVDAASDKDITRLILTQIIIEDAKTPNSSFPLDLLRQMIITSGQASQETVLRYMKAMFDFYQDTYRVMSPAVNPFGMFRTGFSSAASGDQESPGAAPAPAPASVETAPGSEELRHRVAELEKLVSSLGPRKPPRKARKKTPSKAER